MSVLSRYLNMIPLILYLTFPIRPKRDILKNIICPKCKRASQVYKIRYGDALVAGEISGRKINAGSCIEAAATYYCRRDRINF
jgi:hypothetical protein